MKRGLITESHLLVYCHTCGDPFARYGRPVCFASTNDAVAILTHRYARAGWSYDGDTVTCGDCLAFTYCQCHGHTFADTWQLSLRLPARFTRPRICTTCGIRETEVHL